MLSHVTSDNVNFDFAIINQINSVPIRWYTPTQSSAIIMVLVQAISAWAMTSMLSSV
jgi:hypothetical protein